MKERLRNMLMLAGCTTMALLPTACINEDLEDCGKDYRITYDLRLITNMDDEIEEELTTPAEVELGRRLRSALTTNVFREFAHDVDLAFYETDNQTLSIHESHIMDAGQATYTIYMPVQEFKHLAVANIDQNNNTSLTGVETLRGNKLLQQRADTIDSHSNGLFTARLDIVRSEADNFYDVPLYIASDAAALVLDPQDVQTRSIKTYLTDLADGFEVNDSTFTYNNNPIIRTIDLADTGSSLVCHYGVAMPSRDLPMTRTQYDNAEEGAYWEVRCYVTLANGSTTENLLYVKEPLKAGYLKIIKGKVNHDGTIVVENPEVGVSANLEWQPGNTYKPVF